MSKKLFLLVGDSGDGSYHIGATFNQAWIDEQSNRTDPESGDFGHDGDGFHYTTLTVPDECTLESLGITADCAIEELEEVD